MRRLCSTKKLTREEWLAFRKKGIGGSDIAAIAGLNPYSSPLAVYLDKTSDGGLVIEENDAMRWGNILEPVVASEFAKATGFKVRRENAILEHDEYHWALANIDRSVLSEEGRGVLECKTAGFMSSGKWADDKIPDAYLIQVLWYLGVTGYKYGYIACLIGGQKFTYQRIDRDEEAIADLLTIGKAFWERHVLPRVPPPMDGSDAATQWLKKTFAESVDTGGIEVPEAQPWVERYQQVSAKIKELEGEKNLAANNIKNLMRENKYIFCGDCQPTWQTITMNKFDESQFKKDHPDLYAKYVAEKSQRRFSINKRR